MKKKIIITAIIICLLITAFFAAAWHLSSLIMYPEVKCDKNHYIYCTNPSELNLEFDDITFKTSDGLTLLGWLIPAKDSKKAVIIVHGHGGSRNEGLRYVAALKRAGFNALAFNLRNIGDTDKSFASMGFHEIKDVTAAIDFMIRDRSMKSIGLLGFSMGASTGILVMAEDRRVRAGVFSSGYANIADQLAEVGERDFGLPRFPFLTFVMWLTGVRGSFDFDKIDPEKKIGLISPRPVYIMHCTGDDYVNYNHGKRLFSAAGEPKQIYPAPCNRHERVWNVNNKKAESIVVNFFKEHL